MCKGTENYYSTFQDHQNENFKEVCSCFLSAELSVYSVLGARYQCTPKVHDNKLNGKDVYIYLNLTCDQASLIFFGKVRLIQLLDYLSAAP